MNTIKRYPIRIEYKPGTKLKLAEIFSRLYIQFSVSTDGVNPDWTLLVMRNKSKGFPANSTEAIRAMVLKHKYTFLNIIGTCTASLPITTRPPTFQSHRNSTLSCATIKNSSTQACNLYEFLKVCY